MTDTEKRLDDASSTARTMELWEIHEYADCTRCGKSGCKRHSKGVKHIKTLLGLTYKVHISKHYCEHCRRFFSFKIEDSGYRRHYSFELMNEAIRFVEEEGGLEKAQDRLQIEHGHHVPLSTLHGWVIEKRFPDAPDSRYHEWGDATESLKENDNEQHEAEQAPR